jgi:hypothetical protein
MQCQQYSSTATVEFGQSGATQMSEPSDPASGFSHQRLIRVPVAPLNSSHWAAVQPHWGRAAVPSHQEQLMQPLADPSSDVQQ